MGDAMAVGDDQRRPGIGFGFDECFERVFVLGAHRHAGDIDVAVSHGDQAKILLAQRFAARGELRHRSARRGLGHLAAGVGIDFRVEHQHIDVAAAGQDMVQSAVADVVGPAVATDNPDALLDQVSPIGSSSFRFGASLARQLLFQRRHALALLVNAGFVALIGIEDGVDQILRRAAGPVSSAVPRRIPSACRSRPGSPGRTRRCLRTSELLQVGPRPSLFMA